MKKFRDLVEAKDTIVFAFGRFNPPTTGHEKLIQKTAKVAGSNPYRVFPSHTQNPKKDPLPQALKTAYMRKMFKKYARNIVVSKSRNAIEIAVELYNQGYKNLVMIAGSDRVKVFDSMLNQYNGVEGKAHGYYKFDSIEVVSAGERDPDAEGVAGTSASKMRAAAADGDYDSFVTGIPTTLPDGDKKKLYRDVRKYMGIREERDMGDMSDFEAVRDAYLTGKIWNVGAIIETEHGDGEIVRKGTNYLSYMTEDGKVHKSWLHDIAERNYAKEYQNYHSRPEQIANRSSRNKARRIMGDKTKIGMDVGHKDNNPLNNDPKNLRNEDPSKNRREPRLREKPEIDEAWYIDLWDKISRLSHPKGWDKLVKTYVDGMKEPEHRKYPSAWAAEVTRQQTRNITARSLVNYINTLVAKGKLPKELKAEYVSEQMSFRDLVDQIQERELSSNELKRREEIAKDLSDDDFKKKYGARWKEVKMGVATKIAKNEQDDPCWDGYKQIGMKKKNGKKVPNCVPEELNSWGELIEKAEYDGRSVNLNNPTKGDSKKYKVYVKNDKGNVVKVEFGDPDMEIKRDDPKRRAAFRSRHGCDNPGPKWKAKYWSCKFWSAKSVTDLMKG